MRVEGRQYTVDTALWRQAALPTVLGQYASLLNLNMNGPNQLLN